MKVTVHSVGKSYSETELRLIGAAMRTHALALTNLYTRKDVTWGDWHAKINADMARFAEDTFPGLQVQVELEIGDA